MTFNSKNKVLNDILKVAASNIIVLFSGVLVGFLLPKIIGITDYGYYKTYTLYATYVGMFHFGISDGIYLKYGGKDYSQLDRYKFRYYTKTFSFVESIIAVLIMVISIFILNDDIQFIFICLAIYLVFHNITSYYQAISQATSRFNELSQRNIIQSVLVSCIIIGLWWGKLVFHLDITYKAYIILYSIIIIILAIWYVITYREISFGQTRMKKENIREIFSLIILGFPLMLANLCSSLILTLDRQFVNILFDTETYAIYAFAYNMLALVTTATSAISMVLYPNLKKTDERTLKNNYSSLIGAILCLMFGCLSFYFPLNMFVSWFLTKYIKALTIFRIIFPGLAISSAITIVMHNYYKTLGINVIFFVKSVVVLVISASANFLAYKLFGTTESISIASIITMIFWYLLVEYYFVKHYRIKWIKNFVYFLIMMVMFYIITAIPNQIYALIIYAGIFLCITILLYYKDIKNKLFCRTK